MSGARFEPFISDDKKVKEFGFFPVFLGVVLGIVFGASSLYLALKVGMTVSASIPVAVLSITVFRGLSKVFGLRKATILENNIVQTTGSAGESIAFGIAVTMPALLILGFDMELSRIMTVAVLGGLLGVLMMIPLRNALIVKNHGTLAYPEGTACAEVLKVGERGGMTAKTVFTGFFAGLTYKVLNVGCKLWSDYPERAFAWFRGSSVAAEVSPELLGVGYIIGPRVASIMVAGGVLAAWVLTPAIVLFGEKLTTPIFPATKLISEMSSHDIWKSYILYIGAGAVAAGGIISLFQSLPTIIHGAREGFGSVKKSKLANSTKKRTEQDLPLSVVLYGSLALVAWISLTPSLHLNILGAILIVLFGFLFVTVSSRLTGEIGSSSNPISGMTVATLLMTSLIFLALGWVSGPYKVTALSVAAIVCVAASNGGTTSQDLKTGFLVGATPKYQQIALLIGVLSSALVIGYTLSLLNNASTVYSKKDLNTSIRVDVSGLTHKEGLTGPDGAKDPNQYYVLHVTPAMAKSEYAGVTPGKYFVNDSGSLVYLVDPGINGVLKTRDDGTPVQKYDAPKARLMSLIIDGILTRELPWNLVLLGVAIALVLELCGISSLPFAVGVYLPIGVSVPIFIGGLIRWTTDKLAKRKNAEDAESSPGVLYSSGLIAGGAIAGIAIALLALSEGLGQAITLGQYIPAISGNNWTAVIAFGVLAFSLFQVGRRKA